MAKKTKVWLMLAILFIFAGGILFTGVMMALDWDFVKLSTTEFEVNEYEVAEQYENIYIDTETSDVMIIPSDVRKTTVTCFEQENMKHRVAVVDGTLEIKLEDTRAFQHHIAINFRKPQIKVYIPRGEYGDLSIEATTGDVEIHNGFSFENIDVSLTTGDIRCNAIAPGFIVSAQNKALLFNADGTPTARSGKILNGTPMGRFVDSAELLGGMLFLTDDAFASAITGVILPIDCGFAAYSGV